MAENRVLKAEPPARAQHLTADRLPGQFLPSLGIQALAEFISIEECRSVPGGANLFREGDAPAELYVLLEGNVRVSFHSNWGRRFILRIARPGEVLGLAAVVSGQTHATTADPISLAEVSSIRRGDFLAFLRRRPEASWAAMRELASECGRMYRILQTMAAPIRSTGDSQGCSSNRVRPGRGLKEDEIRCLDDSP
jgi:CRP-like cAMP-binding protein